MSDQWAIGIANGIYKPMTKPCKRGHNGARYATNNSCVECAKLRAKQQYRQIRDDPERWEEEKASHREPAI